MIRILNRKAFKLMFNNTKRRTSYAVAKKKFTWKKEKHLPDVASTKNNPTIFTCFGSPKKNY